MGDGKKVTTSTMISALHNKSKDDGLISVSNCPVLKAVLIKIILQKL